MMTAAVTNVQVAQAIGMTHSGVSRIRSGDRLPSIDKMIAIEQVLQWPIGSQTQARAEGRYAAEFEAILAKKYGKAVDDVPVPAS